MAACHHSNTVSGLSYAETTKDDYMLSSSYDGSIGIWLLSRNRDGRLIPTLNARLSAAHGMRPLEDFFIALGQGQAAARNGRGGRGHPPGARGGEQRLGGRYHAQGGRQGDESLPEEIAAVAVLVFLVVIVVIITVSGAWSRYRRRRRRRQQGRRGRRQ